jgi:D-glycero-D-manno-heptose 1,7-bisphosphate phosphatase
MNALRGAVFLDRDGTILDEVGYLNHASRFRMLAGAAEAIARLNVANYPVIVVSNQSGIGRGYFPESVVTDVNSLMQMALELGGARLTAIYYCPHAAPVDCDCRKPKPGMVLRAAKEHGLDLKRSFFVGDRHSDIELGHATGGKSILVRSGYGEGEFSWHVAKWRRQPEHIATELSEAVDCILGKER